MNAKNKKFMTTIAMMNITIVDNKRYYLILANWSK